MEIVVGSSVDKGDQSCWRPWKIIAAMSLAAIIQLIDHPEDQREHMHIVEGESNCAGELNSEDSTDMPKTSSKGCANCPIPEKTELY